MIQSDAMQINKDLPIPLYFQLKEVLRNRIIAQEWKPGKKIPTEAEICDIYSVSRITARKALDELRLDGYLEKKQGKGTFVRNNGIEQKLSKFYSFSEELKSRGLAEHANILQFKTVKATATVAEKLRLAPEENVFCLKRIRFVDDVPYAYEISYLPIRYLEPLTAEMIGSAGLYRSMASLGTSVDNATETMRAINLDAKVAGFLGAKTADAAIYLVRTAYSGQTPVEYCTSTIKGDFFSYTVELK
ncbi:MAG: GntR family transcriptional regulator [Ruthenibacterium sp.]